MPFNKWIGGTVWPLEGIESLRANICKTAKGRVENCKVKKAEVFNS